MITEDANQMSPDGKYRKENHVADFFVWDSIITGRGYPFVLRET